MGTENDVQFAAHLIQRTVYRKLPVVPDYQDIQVAAGMAVETHCAAEDDDCQNMAVMLFVFSPWLRAAAP